MTLNNTYAWQCVRMKNIAKEVGAYTNTYSVCIPTGGNRITDTLNGVCAYVLLLWSWLLLLLWLWCGCC